MQKERLSSIMNKTTKLHKYAILWLASQGVDLETIAKEVKLSTVQVTRVINSNNKQTVLSQHNQEQDQNKNNNSRSKSLMITDSNAKKFKVAIMTKDASMLNDELKKNNTTTKNTQDYIYRQDNE